ncbi:zinc finger protein 593-like [Orbicella faveolata]|uniref:zinc finger protein 593-like n=1 Tax=Orbicella faveolata TaxID=48498 RepID=UPI0009E61532|nr:zinc finger protein 593-like [Orbicella faveolata]
MGRLRRKRMHKNDKHLKKKYRTRRRTKDLDQIHEDMQPKNAAKLKSQECDMDLPGSGQYYCIHCARYFVDEKSLKDHIKSRVHRKKVKMLKEVPYTPEEAERAAGMGSYTLISTKPLLPVNQDKEMTNSENVESVGT